MTRTTHQTILFESTEHEGTSCMCAWEMATLFDVS